MPWKSFLVEDEYCVFLLDADDNRTGSSLGCHETKAEADGQVAALNISEDETRNLFSKFWKSFKALVSKERTIVDVDEWDGSASNYSTTEAYCNACLINLNEGDPEDWTQANCKLPVRREGDSSDTFVRQAVFAAAARFDQVDAPAEAKEAARTKLLQAYSEMDLEPPENIARAISGSLLFDSLWQRMFELDSEIEGSNHFLVDMFFDDNGFYALYVDRGKLFRYDIIIQDNEVALGERVEVMELHQPVETRTIIRQQEDGRHRWFSISGTAVLNRSGEIDSRALFDSCVAYAKETGKYPIRMFYHKGYISRDWEIDESALAYKTGQADFLARDGFCYITSGLYDDTPLAQAEIKARQDDPSFWGDSIGFWPTEEPELTEISDGIKIPVYNEGFNVEITTLPEADAAHLFTRTEVARMTLNGNEWEAFLKLWGGDEDKARQWIEDNPQARNRAIEQAGMITRKEELAKLVTLFNEDKDKAIKRLGELADELSEDDDTVGDKPPTDIIIDESVIEAVTKSEVFIQLSDRLTQIETQLTEQPEVVQLSEVEELRSTLGKLTKRLETLEKGEATIQQQVVDDTPAKFNGKPKMIYRPREANAALVEDGIPYSEKAKANLPKGANY